jgi:acetolactate synthase-1/2/3 large subunit
VERRASPSQDARTHRDAWDRTEVDAWLKHINTSKGTAAVRDIINLPDNGHLYAAHVIHDIWREGSFWTSYG